MALTNKSVIQITYGELKKLIEARPAPEIITIRQFRERTRYTYHKIRYMYEIQCPHIFTEKKPGRQRKVKWHEYQQLQKTAA